MPADEPPPTLGERIFAGVLIAAATVLTSVLESFLVVLRVGDVRLPVSILLALGLNPLLVWLMARATGSRLALLAPPALWLAVVLLLGTRRPEGDVVITGNNWVATGFLLAGGFAFAITIGLLLPRPSPRGRSGR